MREKYIKTPFFLSTDRKEGMKVSKKNWILFRKTFFLSSIALFVVEEN